MTARLPDLGGSLETKYWILDTTCMGIIVTEPHFRRGKCAAFESNKIKPRPTAFHTDWDESGKRVIGMSFAASQPCSQEQQQAVEAAASPITTSELPPLARSDSIDNRPQGNTDMIWSLCPLHAIRQTLCKYDYPPCFNLMDLARPAPVPFTNLNQRT